MVVYSEFFGLEERPFSLTPNPRYAFYSDQYRAALEQLLYGLEQKEGFLLLTGMVGTGKTTLCRDLFNRLSPNKYRTALIFNPFLSGHELLQSLLSEFGCSYTREMGRKDLLDRLNRYLLSQLVAGNICIAVFDEAQNLSVEFLEQIRVLSNLETETEKLLQIVLVGQPELRQRIEQPNLAQLDQRVSMRLTLRGLTREETERFVYHRLNIAGSQGGIEFKRSALKMVHESSGGIPRIINQICDRSLLAGYVERTRVIGAKQVRQALAALRGSDEELQTPPQLAPSRGRRLLVATAAAAILLVVGAGAALVWWGVLP